MRVLSGYAKVNEPFRHEGTATIDFNNFQVVGNASGQQLKEIPAAGGRFTSAPAFHIAPRSFATGNPAATISIKVTSVDTQRLTIEWSNSPDTTVIDISFLVIGE